MVKNGCDQKSNGPNSTTLYSAVGFLLAMVKWSSQKLVENSLAYHHSRKLNIVKAMINF
jgi:hypothetical protein